MMGAGIVLMVAAAVHAVTDVVMSAGLLAAAERALGPGRDV